MFERAHATEVAYALAGFDERTADPGELLDAIEASARAIGWLQARQAELIAEVSRRQPELPAPAGASPLLPAAAEVGALLTWSHTTALARVHAAVALATREAATLSALRAGRIDAAKADAIVSAVMGLDDEQAGEVEARALRRASGQTLAQLRAVLRRAVMSVDPRTADERYTDAREQRRVVIAPAEEGMATLWALLSAADAAAIGSVLDQAGRCAAGEDTRTVDQRRADAFVELVTGVREERPRPQIQVSVPVGTVLGLDDEPGRLAGHGPIPAALARELAADGTWRRLLTDPDSGVVRDVGTTRYRPPANLDALVRFRDGTCRAPGCRRRAAACDLDHAVPFPQGPTSTDNLHALCRRHHRLKHESDWSVDAAGDGHLEWVSPFGARYRTSPAPPDEESSTRRTDPSHPDDPFGDWLLDLVEAELCG